MVATYPLVPRYMLPSAPYYSTQILGASCNYQQDNWDTQSAYIAYACPDLDVLRLSVRFTSLEDGQTAQDLFGEFPPEDQEVIVPGDSLNQYENLSLFGRAENEKYSYFMVYETGEIVISSEVFFPEDTTISLEEFYTENGEIVLNAVLEIMLEKVISEGTRPEPTPMAVAQQELYNQFAPWLVTESEMNEFYKGASDMFGDPFDGTWKLIGDQVDIQRGSLCREFADRSNEDAPLVKSFNCMYQREPGYTLSKLQESFPDAIVLESAFEYPEQSIIYGRDQMHTSFQVFILRDNLLFYVYLESRVLAGQTAEDVFNEYNDNFIYNVMMTNMDRYGSDATDVSESQEDSDDPFIGTWESNDPGDGSNQQLVISKNNDVYTVDYYDDVASSCGLDSAGKTIAAAGTGLGSVNGVVLSVDFSIYCLTAPQSFLASFHVDSTYNISNNTIEDSSTTWNRP